MQTGGATNELSSDPLRFGVSLPPDIAHVDAHAELVTVAKRGGLDLIGIQDHPYAPRQLDTFSLIGMLLARTTRVSFFADVANLPLRPPAMLAKAVASLDVLSGGRMELGLGAGGYWDAIESFGGGRLSRRDANDALEESIALIRALWSGTRNVDVEGRFYELKGARGGPVPAHPVEIWIGAQGPRALRLTGRIADGWAAPIPSYLPYEVWPDAQHEIDKGALSADREPLEIRRIAQLVGTVTDAPGPQWTATGAEPIRSSAEQWAAILERLGREMGFTGFVFWPEKADATQIRRFAEEAVPRARELLDATDTAAASTSSLPGDDRAHARI